LAGLKEQSETGKGNFRNTMGASQKANKASISDQHSIPNYANTYVREKAFVKESANLTTVSFCRWVNEHLLAKSRMFF